MLTLDDFIKSSYFSFEVKVDIWKKETDLFVDIPNNNEKNIQNYLNLIQDEINWIENNKYEIKQILLEEDILELAENTSSSAHLLECADEECYLMDDGSKVYFPITKDDFLDSLYIESVSIYFDESNSSTLELTLLCSPDYFRGKSLQIVIDKNKNIKFNGLEDD